MKSIVIILSFFCLALSYKDADTMEPTNNCLSAEEKKLYTSIMAYRKENHLPEIPLSTKLTEVAKAHTLDLMDNYKFSFDNKCNPHSWSNKGKWSACCYTPDHKEAACMWNKPKEIAGYNGNGYEIAYYTSGESTAEEALDGWKKSPGHNPLLINSGIWANVKWKAIGVALHGNYGVVWFGEIGDDSPFQKCD